MQRFLSSPTATAIATLFLTGCSVTQIGDPVQPAPFLPFADSQAWILKRAMVYKIGASADKIVVPPGFVTDFASTPRLIWGVLSPHDSYSRAAVVHDYLYWTQVCTRAQSDNIMRLAMIESEVPLLKQWAVHEAVKLFGNSAWDENTALRKQGFIRVLPPGTRHPRPNETWVAYRSEIREAGVRESLPAIDNRFCQYGNSTEVPR